MAHSDRRPGDGCSGAKVRGGAEEGQATVELAAGATVIAFVALLGLQLLAAGYAAVMADHAAEAGALALANRRTVGEAARSAVPGWPRSATRVEIEGGAVRVTLVPPSPLPFLRRRLAVTGRAAVRRPAWDR
jgi:hypothetical protein